MGSCLSNQSSFNANKSFDGFYTRPTTEGDAEKRQSCGSNSSSGVFSLYSSPSRGNRCNTNINNNNNNGITSSSDNITNYTSPLRKQKPRSTQNKEVDRMSVIHDFGEMKMQEDLNQSRGYFTKSISSQSGDDEIYKSNSNLRYTRDTSSKFQQDVMNDDKCDDAETDYDHSDILTGCSLEMEMFMLSTARGIIGKTSSPMPQRRGGHTCDVPATTSARHSDSYNIWCNVLENTPTCMLQNVTRIPEAVAGRFCPSDFPAFINVEVDNNEAKRFKLDTEEFESEFEDTNNQINAVTMTHRQPIMTTEL